ncbi:unnamed protein product, partial [marine sediment metagenome]
FPGDPEEIKYAACPNIDHITKADIPALLEELDKNDLIKVYPTSKTKAIQLLDWWDVHRPQWAWPSQYPPPEGWEDHLRYKRGAKTVVTENWPVSGETQNDTQVSNDEVSGELSGEQSKNPLTTPYETEKERGKRKEERGNSPEPSGEKPPPLLTGLSLFESLKDTFPKAFGKKPDSRQIAQLRDLGKEISSAGGATGEQVYDAFKEACDQNKFSVRYVRAILLDWLGVPRAPP